MENKPSSNEEKYPRFSCFSPVFGIKNGIKATNIEVETPWNGDSSIQRADAEDKTIVAIRDDAYEIRAIQRHVDEEDKTVNDSFTVNGTPLVFINESGLYALILSSYLELAQKCFCR